MSRFERQGLRRYSAGDAIRAVLIVVALLILLSGGSVRDAAAELEPGIGQDLITAVGEPAGWVADRFPLDEAQNKLTGGLSPDGELAGGGFEDAAAETGAPGELPPVTPEAFDPAAIGAEPAPKLPLETVLVTGDSLATPLDSEIARRLAGDGVEVVRDPHLASGISNSDIVDWGQLAVSQVEEHDPDAVVVFIGANEGYSMPGPAGKEVDCCGPEWAAIFANRARQMIDTYRQDGEARVYWLSVMTPRDADAARVAKVVNAGIEVAAQPWRSQVRLLDMVSLFTPGERYTDSIEVDGAETLVRESDGIHLNEAGSALAAELVLERIDADFSR
jgi:hypothetical protein